ncbi:MAG: hypothetical protein E7H60_23100 [Pseudomonas oryzihabitans]|uniref:hypothetical protein n=1 Tax=Pseudomonas oryzihabitans TaxID=47885 RepID=UPI0011AA081D|nr:hypothetical protein [Pseudomonas oryzihabitans]MDU4059437.1 hypothetical protein [Pseudomonas oryzihabitans]
MTITRTNTEVLDALSAEGINLPGLAISILERLEREDAERRAFQESKQRKGHRPEVVLSPGARERQKAKASKPHPRSGKELRRQAERRGTLHRSGLTL